MFHAFKVMSLCDVIDLPPLFNIYSGVVYVTAVGYGPGVLQIINLPSSLNIHSAIVWFTAVECGPACPLDSG